MNNESNIQKHLAEQTIMFASITKWIFLSSLIGALVGAVVSLFLKLLTYCENSRSVLPFDYYYTLPFALVINESVPWYTFILKTIFTSLTLAFGGSGGVITPIFYVGATSGNLFGYLVDGYIPLFAALGFVSVLAGATSAPIAAMIMSVELFGMNVGHYAAISIIIAFLMTGHRSVFPSQVLSMKKSEAINIKLGDEIENAEMTYTTRFFVNIRRIFSLIMIKIKNIKKNN